MAENELRRRQTTRAFSDFFGESEAIGDRKGGNDVEGASAISEIFAEHPAFPSTKNSVNFTCHKRTKKTENKKHSAYKKRKLSDHVKI